MLEAILWLLPALLLAIVMLARRYPGERALIGRRRERGVSWPHPRSSVKGRRGIVTVAVHGGLLIARSLAVRPPPAVALTS